MVKKTTHERSQVLNRSWSKGSSTGASDRDAVLVIPLQQGECISHGGEKHGVVHISWGRKAHLVWKFPGEKRGCNVVAELEDCCT
ncbi:hypothetical protein DY000_02059664 [Brassica cretica]|uniref:Uncharacterized protein n=1 Tax=Brassica cretica TaxID=69181 RepID=A0ABQ7AVF4_BRACR|nr:hypothetical protein DY000_02059664 [Brassica cretica]